MESSKYSWASSTYKKQGRRRYSFKVDRSSAAWVTIAIMKRYCGTLTDIPVLTPRLAPATAEEVALLTEAPRSHASQAPLEGSREFETQPAWTANPLEMNQPRENVAEPSARRPERPIIGERELGKGGKQHRYLQSLVKELAEQSGLKATIEAPLEIGPGQLDVLLERDGVVAAIEISVTTPVDHERENLRKCLACKYPRIAVVLAKSKKTEASYRASLLEIVPESERDRVRILSPEEVPEFIESLSVPPSTSDRTVKGYRVKGSFTETLPADTKARQEALAHLIAKSLRRRA